MRHKEFLARYKEELPRLRTLDRKIKSLLEDALRESGSEFQILTSRIKSAESAYKKSEAKPYNDPFTECTDLVGFRIVVYLESHVDKVAEAIKNYIDVDENNSIDKRYFDRADSVGYRSLHIVGKIDNARRSLPEYRNIGDLNFEIQIRTALQNTWAEIEHKYNYKGLHALPDDLAHRLMVLAGTLELIDREFAQITHEAAAYARSISEDDQSEKNENLSKLAIIEVLRKEISLVGGDVDSLGDLSVQDAALTELNGFGINTVADLTALLKTVDLKTLFDASDENQTVTGLIRDFMICRDAERYFNDAWRYGFSTILEQDIPYLEEASGRTDLYAVFKKYSIEIEPPS
ncbi:GTP pyrophosphokinase [Pseudoroseicyclus aestuarii]|uniref:PpGpp synthetase/RelA/SpoT-type nucleotidyltransferase n=1 Tax=Pseudoroseicyclus aestuarii TaxID=1795041 RepID=A0A318T5T7_9RHOB|nr:hypothetical protein [Pseudoroseicyclus aestuarii]PYE85764.1 ppGpp synthetase/RelA/SpoT-type nucleotidyltransferase [Pseudoroseicyclus aestuarii]